MEFRKMVMITLCETAKETQMYRTDFRLWGEGEGGVIWENGIETCILSGKKKIASLCSIQDTGYRVLRARARG